MVRRSEPELIQQLLHGQDDRNWSFALARLRFVPEAFPPRTHNADFVARVVLPVPSSDFTSTQPQEGSNGNSNSGRFEQNLKHLENFDENYWRSTQPTTKTIGWSLTKSLVSALVGIAIADGKIGSVNDAVTQYVPELKGSAYDVSGSKTFYRCRRVPLGTRTIAIGNLTSTDLRAPLRWVAPWIISSLRSSGSIHQEHTIATTAWTRRSSVRVATCDRPIECRLSRVKNLAASWNAR